MAEAIFCYTTTGRGNDRKAETGDPSQLPLNAYQDEVLGTLIVTFIFNNISS